MTARTPHVVELERRYGRHGERILDALRAAHEARGRITAHDEEAIARALDLPRAHVHGAATYYADLRPVPEGARGVRACVGTACFAATAGRHLAGLRRALGPEAAVQEVHCLGYCYASPAALEGETAHAGPDLAAQLTAEIRGGSPHGDPAIPWAAAVDEPVLLGALTGHGPAPWEAWRDVLASGEHERVLAEVETSGLSGRGGAAFPTAAKWQTARAARSTGRAYVVANGDEGDPGSFADRLLMEAAPHRLLEGLALAGLATGARRGIAYVRSEYPRARETLREAVERARAGGDLGYDVHGTGLDFDVEVVVGAGSYVAGEETALIRALEGVRGGVAARPPYPAEEGLLRRPTVVNNVETLAAVPWIVARGGAAYAARGTPASRGTKLACLNERFRRPGVYEVELGVPVRYLVDELGGGLRDGRALRVLQVGGPLGGFLAPEALDTPFSVEGMRGAGIELGHGGLVAIDEGTPPADLLVHLWTFAADESCGACSPCRVGSRRGLELARRIAREGPHPALMGEMTRLLDVMGTASLCNFGLGMAPSVRSLLRACPELARMTGKHSG